MISTPLTTGLIARHAQKKYDLPYVFEVGDLWPEAPIQLGVLKNPLLKQLAYRLERSIYRHAQHIVALSPDIQKAVTAKTDTPVEVVTNLADTAYFSDAHDSEAYKAHLGYSGKFVIAYTGTIGLANHLEYLIDVARQTSNNPSIQYIILGSGGRSEAIKTLAKQHELDNIAFIDQSEKNIAREVLYAADAIYVSFKKVPILATGSPNKFFDGLAAGKLIIMNFKGWIKKLVDEHQCGFFYNPESPGEFSDRLKPFLMDENKLMEAQKNAASLANEFTIEQQLSKLDSLLKELLR